MSFTPQFQNGGPYQTQAPSWQNTGTTLADVYQNKLGRTGDAAGMQFWQSQMDNPDNPMSLDQVRSHIAGSEEGMAYQNANPASTIFDVSNQSLIDAMNGLSAGMNYQAPTVRASNIKARQLSDTNLDPYMNPYTQAVTDTTMSELERQRQIAMNQTNSAASGAFGGSRHGVMQAETNRGFGDIAARTTAGLNSDNFMQAQGAAFQDIGNSFSAAQSNQAAQLQAQLANASNGLSGNSQRTMAASNLANVSNMGFSRGQSALDAQLQAGNQQQALQQQLIDAAKQQTMGDTGFSDEAISRIMSVLGGIPIPKTQTQSSNPGLLGLLSAFL
jgi:hypothetical protein